MNLKTHINCICKSGFYHIKNPSSTRDSLDKVTANIAARAFVTSKLDYGNASLFGLPAAHLYKLQLVQNAAGSVVAKVRKYSRKFIGCL